MLPAVTVMVPGCDGVMTELVRAREPLQAGAPSYASNIGEESATTALPLLMAGCSVPVPDAGIIRSSGFRYHSDTGVKLSLPFTTSSVIVQGAKVCVAFHAVELDAVIDPDAVDESVYAT